ncbi:hydrogenase maturation protease [Geobacter sp. DSM 9736]|uniref:hydrogenase maturation protease n=1 Tax=Geobacter sp. DSM 9736 TaxID=1277350 RepID=UPI000B507114|nr:hydrogenase maturation protease [Geobacter sp. DSM 9736]SNB44948.1 hydrogenase maturation protease [Geobacter sp. DSM 9736]
MGTRSIIIGMGNALLTDDGVGIHVVREIAPAVRERNDVEVCELGTGGIRLMEAMAGFDRAYVVDAIITGEHVPGTVLPFEIERFVTTKNTVSTHDTDLATALQMGRMAGIHLPEEIRVWGVEASEVETFSEELTPSVAATVPLLVGEILGVLECDRRKA